MQPPSPAPFRWRDIANAILGRIAWLCRFPTSRPVLLSLAMLGFAACQELPPPPNQTYGVFAYDDSTRTLWMRGDERYYVPESVNTGRLYCASRITVTWEQQGDRRVVQRFSVAEWSDVLC